MKNLFIKIDRKVDKKLNPFFATLKKYFSVFSATLLGLLVIFFVLRIIHDRTYFASTIINDDLRTIVTSLEQIDRDCSILSFDDTKNNVDFLNVKKFVGSEVGSLNLAYPKKWQGPYLDDNPTFQGKAYQVVRAKDGIYVLPGDGVELPNRKIVGKSFEISTKTLFAQLIKKGGELNYKGMPLAIKLKFKIGDWSKVDLKEKKIREISSDIEEFNEAMSFAHNQTSPYNY